MGIARYLVHSTVDSKAYSNMNMPQTPDMNETMNTSGLSRIVLLSLVQCPISTR